MHAGLQCPLWAGLLCEVLRPNFTTTPIIQHLPSLTPAVTYWRIGFARKHGVNSGWACELAPQPIVCTCEIRLQTAGTLHQNPTQLSFLSQKRLHKEKWWWDAEVDEVHWSTGIPMFLMRLWEASTCGSEEKLINTSHLKIGPKRKVHSNHPFSGAGKLLVESFPSGKSQACPLTDSKLRWFFPLQVRRRWCCLLRNDPARMTHLVSNKQSQSCYFWENLRKVWKVNLQGSWVHSKRFFSTQPSYKSNPPRQPMLPILKSSIRYPTINMLERKLPLKKEKKKKHHFGYPTPGDSSPDLLYPLFAGHQQPLKRSRVHHPKNGTSRTAKISDDGDAHASWPQHLYSSVPLAGCQYHPAWWFFPLKAVMVGTIASHVKNPLKAGVKFWAVHLHQQVSAMNLQKKLWKYLPAKNEIWKFYSHYSSWY